MAAPIAAFKVCHDVSADLLTDSVLSAINTEATPGSAKSVAAKGALAACTVSAKKNGPPACTIVLTVNVQVSGSAIAVSALIVIGARTCVACRALVLDIFRPVCRRFIGKFSESCKRMNPAVMTIVPVKANGIVADAHDLLGRNIGTYGFWIKQWAAAHLFDTQRTLAGQA